MGFENEKDHPEVAPSQFEMNYSYTEALIAADQVQLYKLLCRQVARKMDMTASFLPKPVTGVNGNGMHTNMSIAKGGKNLFWDDKGRGRRLEDGLGLHRPHPQQRVRHLPDPQPERERVPPPRPALRGAEPDQGLGRRPRRDGAHPDRQRASARVEVRSVAPDANPYMAVHLLRRARRPQDRRTGDEAQRTRFLPDNIYDAIRLFKGSEFSRSCSARTSTRSSPTSSSRQAERCPKALGSRVKTSEIQFHHEVTNQYLWSQF
jgi:glutamine synthetase